MKKKFLLFVAFVCSLSLFAAQPTQKLQVAKPGLFAPSLSKTDMSSMSRGQKVAEHQKALDNAKAQKIAKAPAAKRNAAAYTDTAYISIKDFSVENYGSSDWPDYLFMLFGTDTKTGDSCYIVLDCYPAVDNYVGIDVNSEDMSLAAYYGSAINNLTQSSSIWLADPIDGVPQSVSTFKADTISAGLWNVNAKLIGEDDVVYVLEGTNIVYNHPAKVSVNANQVALQKYGPDESMIYLYAEEGNAVNAFVFDVFAEGGLESGKTYIYDADHSDLDLSYTYVYLSEIQSSLYIVEAEITPYLDKSGQLTKVEFKLLTDLFDEYSGVYELPQVPQSYKDMYLTANNVDLYDATETSAHVFQFLGVSEDGMWNLSVAGEADVLLGQQANIIDEFTYIGFTDENIDYIKNIVEVKNVEVNQVASENPALTGLQYTCTADFYCYDGNCYHVTLNRVAPAQEGTYTYKAHNTKLLQDPSVGKIFASHDTACHYMMQIAVSSLHTGEYGEAEVQGLVYDMNNDTYPDIYRLYGVKLLVEKSMAVGITGNILFTDGLLMPFYMDQNTLEPTSDDLLLDVDVNASKIHEEDNSFYIDMITNNDEELFLTLPFSLNQSLSVAIPLQYADADASYFMLDASSYYASTEYTIDDGSMLITYNGKDELGFDVYRVKLNALVSSIIEDVAREDTMADGLYYYYDDVMWVKVDTLLRLKNGIDGDEELQDIETAYDLQDVSVVTGDVTQGKWYLLQGKNAEGLLLAVVFFSDQSAASMEIPCGTYTFASDTAMNTCFASPGIGESGSPQASYLARPDAILGLFIDQIWYLNDGIAKVAKNEDQGMMVLIQATNSYGRKVTINVNNYPDETALPSVREDAGVMKTLENGNLILYRNNQRFSVTGQEL